MKDLATRITAALLLTCAGLAPASAHHSVAGVFDVTKSVTLSGTISRIDWINPHTYIYVDVKEAGGAMTTWKLESLPVAMMRKAGLSQQSILGNGQHVVVEAHPARSGVAAFGYALKISYDDGRQYQFGRGPDDKPIFIK